jgi:hypothetical protein
MAMRRSRPFSTPGDALASGIDKVRLYLFVGASFLMASAVEVLTLGCVRLRIDCNMCRHEIVLRNIWSHMRWHLKRGDWR